MKQQRAPFQPLDNEFDDKIETLAREKGVSTLVKPAQAEQRPAAIEKPTQAATEAAPPRTPMKALNVELPDYVWTALKIRAAEQKTSVRHVIMAALRNEGISIAEADMIDASLRVRGGHRARS